MTLLKDSAASFLTLIEQGSDPADPASGNVKLYAKTDGTLAYLDDASAEHVLGTVAAGVYDAADITYTPTTLTDWDSDADPGDVDGALDQLAERVDDIEAAGGAHAAVTLGADAGAVLGLTGQQIDLDTQTANYVFAGPTTGAAADPTFRALVAADLPVANKTDQNIFTREGAVTATAGTIRIYNHTGATLTISKVYADVNTAPTGANLIVDIHKDGTTIFTTQGNRPEIAASANSSGGETPDVTAWEDGKWLTCDVDQVGSSVAGSDLTVTVVYTH